VRPLRCSCPRACHVCTSCIPLCLQAQPLVSARQAVIFCPTCGARHGLWTFLGGQATAVKSCWPAGSPLPPLLGGASPRGTRGAAQRGGLDPATHSAPPKSRAGASDAVAVVGEGNDRCVASFSLHTAGSCVHGSLQELLCLASADEALNDIVRLEHVAFAAREGALGLLAAHCSDTGVCGRRCCPRQCAAECAGVGPPQPDLELDDRRRHAGRHAERRAGGRARRRICATTGRRRSKSTALRVPLKCVWPHDSATPDKGVHIFAVTPVHDMCCDAYTCCSLRGDADPFLATCLQSHALYTCCA